MHSALVARLIPGSYDVQCLVIDNSKRSTVRLSVLKALDAFENEGALPSSQYCRQPPSQRTAMPNADVTPSNAIDFGTVRYGLPVRQTFEIRNTGQVIAQFRFMPKPQTNSIVKPWLWLSPISGLILPGDSETITCTLNIDNEAASHFNFSDDDLSDIAILSIVGGRDAFMSLSAREYLPTCFCNPFEQLARLERPIREYSTEERALLMLRANEPPIEPPRELMRLTEWLTAHALEEVR